tara:strand:- start:3782 stop:4408 length:627 start_codon:yes stop_codon:yes gene_type:complete
MFKNILILAPHTDDGEFGCGGSIAKFINEGSNVFYAAFSTAEKSVPKHLPKDILKTEVQEATKRLGIPKKNLLIYDYEVRKLNYFRQDILEHLVELKNNIKPDLVFLPSPNDLHQDHQTISQEGLRAFKTTTILAYELPWNTITFRTQSFIKLTEENVKIKINALEAYNSQKHRNYASEEFVKSLALTRGTQIGTTYAEAFEVIRWVQ